MGHLTSRRPVVLAVDDDPGSRESYAVIFEQTIDVVPADSAATAIAVARGRHLDAILLDIRMQHVSGFEAFGLLRTTQPGVPIIFVTAVDSAEMAVAAMRLGAFDYITKPFDEDRLAGVVKLATVARNGLVHVVHRDVGLAAAAVVLASARAGIPVSLSPTGSVVRTVEGGDESLAELYRRIAPGSPLTERVERVAAYVGRHYARVNVDGLAEAMRLTPNHLSRVLREETTLTAKEYVTRVRIEVARYLLKTTRESLEVIAQRVGLWGASHLSRVVRQHLGVPPGALRA